MTDTASSRYGLRQQSQGSNTNSWGDDKLNEALRLLDRGSKGYQALAVTGDATLSWTNYIATNDGQCAVLKLTGSLSSVAAITVPSTGWVWDLIWNTTGQTVTVKTSAGTGIAIPNGRQVGAFCDASDVYFAAPNYIGLDITEANSRDLIDKAALDAAIATSTIPAATGAILISATDTTAGYIGTKIAVSGALIEVITNPTGNALITLSVGDGGLIDGGLKSASFTAAVGTSYTVPVGGTIVMPTASGTRRKIALTIAGVGISTLTGLINSLTSFPLEGNQTVYLTDYDAVIGWA